MNNKKPLPQPVEGVDFIRTGVEVVVNAEDAFFEGMRGVTVTPLHQVPRGTAVVQLIGSPVGLTEHPVSALDPAVRA